MRSDRPTLLEPTTKLGRNEAGWALSLYPTAGEASGSFRPSTPSIRRSGGGPSPDETRSEEEAARRARGKVRRYCAANRPNRLGTLTYRGTGNHDPMQLRTDVADFFRNLRALLGEPFAYLWTPEWHPGGHGLHVQFGAGRFIRRSWIEEAWGHGFVHIKLLGDLGVGSTALHEARAAARYLGKYVGKSYADGGEGPNGAQRRRAAGLHRYEVAQGFQPRPTLIKAATVTGVLNEASERMGRPPGYVWESWNEKRWFGPRGGTRWSPCRHVASSWARPGAGQVLLM